MAAQLTFFPVGNGDMTLIRTEQGNGLLIDVNIRSAADDPDDDTPDVAKKLREKLVRDTEGRLYVDALLISHPDQDHCRGLRKHFHLGPPDKWSKSADKILIGEIWSSPMVFRRASSKNTLCDDAKAFNAEARRRVRVFRHKPWENCLGNRIRILGEDEDGKTDELKDILVPVDGEFSSINGEFDSSMIARLLAPLPADGHDDHMSKNDSSTILRFSLSGGGISDKCRFLTGGDAEVAIWEKLWNRYHWRADYLSYDILLSPHHCSWHSLSYDSWSEKGEDAQVCEDALSALSQIRSGATIVASRVPIEDNDNDPPSIRAEREYQSVCKNVKGSFICVGENPSKKSPHVLEFEVGAHGVRRLAQLMAASALYGSEAIGRQPLSHG